MYKSEAGLKLNELVNTAASEEFLTIAVNSALSPVELMRIALPLVSKPAPVPLVAPERTIEPPLLTYQTAARVPVK